MPELQKEVECQHAERGRKEISLPGMQGEKRKEVKTMPDKLFLDANDIVKIMGVAKPTAYALMRRLNRELEAKGYIVICGKVSTQYFF